MTTTCPHGTDIRFYCRTCHEERAGFSLEDLSAMEAWVSDIQDEVEDLRAWKEARELETPDAPDPLRNAPAGLPDLGAVPPGQVGETPTRDPGILGLPSMLWSLP